MRTIIDNFLNFRAQNVELVVVWVLVGTYLLLVLTSLLSVLSRSRSKLFKLVWSLVVTALPFVGMALYAFVCLWMADRSILNQMGFSTKRHANRSVVKSLDLKAGPQ